MVHLQMMSPDWNKYRDDFPVLQKYSYLNNAAISPIPKTVYQQAVKFYRDSLYYGGTLWNRWEKMIEQTRELYANFIGAAGPEEIAFTHSTSEGMNIVAHMLSEKGIVILNDLEFPATNLPWINKNDGRENLKFVKARDQNKILIKDIVEMIDKTNSLSPQNVVKTIVTSHVQYSTGFKQDLKQLAKISKKYGIFLVVNATQSLGCMYFNVKDFDIDFASSNGHKWLLSSFGIGSLYIKGTYLQQPNQFKPAFFSQSGQRERNLYSINTQMLMSNTATKFEVGSPNLPNISALNAGLQYISTIGIKNIEQRILQLTDYIIDKLHSINLKILSPIENKNNRSGIILFQSKNRKPLDIIKILEKKYKIIVSARSNGIRISPHFYNNEDDIDKLVSALEKIFSNSI